MIKNFLLGTYTKRTSEGVYTIKLDAERNEFFDLTLEKKISNPTFVSKKDNVLCALSNVEGLGGISVFYNDVELHNNSEKSTPCYISNLVNNYLITANYHDATLVLYKLENNCLKIVDTLSNKREGEVSHMHFSEFCPCGNIFYACDLGLDEVYSYKIENDKMVKLSTYKTEKGSGPRHLVFNKKHDTAYLICELSSTIEVLAYDKTSHSFTKKQVINMLDDNNGKNWAAAIKITNDEKYLYASNRGDDLIVAFSINDDNTLTKIASYETFGSVARDFCITNDDKYLIVAHQESDNITLYARENDGKLTLIKKDVFAPECVCIKEI